MSGGITCEMTRGIKERRKIKRDQGSEKHHLKMDENTQIEVIRNPTFYFTCKNCVIVGDVTSCG